MINLPLYLDKIINATREASLACGYRSYLYGQNVMYMLLEQPHLLDASKLDIILCSKDKFDVNRFYKELLKGIDINKEIENSEFVYSFISSDVQVSYHIENDLTYDVIKKYTFLTLDGVFLDIVNKNIIDNLQGLHDLQNKPPIIRSTYIDWSTDEILEFIYINGIIKGVVDDNNLKKLQEITINDLEPTLNYLDFIDNLLDLRYPGNAIKFTLSTFKDGKTWLFSNLLNYLGSINVQVKEDISADSIFQENKLDLIDAYSDFFEESGTLQDHKKETFVRLLLDSPDLEIKTPYLSQAVNVQTMSVCTSDPAWQTYLQDVCNGCQACEDFISNPNNREILCNCVVHEPGTCDQIFRDCCPDCPPGTDPRCPYGVCPDCIPSRCREGGHGYGGGGQACCCCDSLNYTAPIKVRCHNKIMASCNQTGDAPGPVTYNGSGDPFPHCKCDPFPPGCAFCFETCQRVLSGDCENLIEWFNLPPADGPCYCYCPDEFKVGELCTLTCAVCGGVLCESDIHVEGGDCAYRISVTPSRKCCGEHNQNNQNINTSVYAGACIQFAGQDNSNPDGINYGSGIDYVSSHLPVTVDISGVIGDITIGPTTGTVHGAGIQQDEDANGAISIPPVQTDAVYTVYGISSVLTNASALVGVFLTNNPPVPPAPPINLIPYGPDNINHTPELQQVFFIGKDQQPFTPPAGATRLFLGVHDEHNWSDNTGHFDTQVSFSTNEFELPTSCDCMDMTPIPVKRCTSVNGEGQCTSWSDEIPIGMCLKDDLSDCDCSADYVFDVCGHTFTIAPHDPILRCCDDVGFGCNCTAPCDPLATCEPDCDICTKYRTVEEAVRGVWCNCWNSYTPSSGCTDCCCPDPTNPESPDYPCELISPDPNDPERIRRKELGTCCDCSSSQPELCCDCYVNLPDGNCNTYQQSRSQVEALVRQKWADCCGAKPPAPPWKCDTNCRQKDDCIIGSDDVFPNVCGENRSDEFRGCVSTKHPSTVVLNNGVGLVAYETWETIPTIKIQQFKTSLKNKILPNREFNFGRLENIVKWTKDNPSAPTVARLYYYENAPLHWLSGTSQPQGGGNWTGLDGIAFRSGPLQHQCFPLYDPPYGTDVHGDNYIAFIVPDNIQLTNPFPSNDDVYNVKWFIFDSEDTGVIGNSYDTTTDGKEFIIQGRSRVDNFLQLPPHVYNGQQVPTANPSLAVAKNYEGASENSHYVYLAYQALENKKWNVYLRQIRLSEYDRRSQTENPGQTMNSLKSLGITDLKYRAICIVDNCQQFGTQFILTRTITMQLFTLDGREVYNMGLQGFWNNICPGGGEFDFPKNFVYAKLTHSVVADKCPESSVLDLIFYDWQTGDEFIVPAESVSPISLFNILVKDDAAVPIGEFNPPMSVGGVNITSSHAGSVWYEDSSVSTWGAMSGGSLEVLTEFKGLDIDQPILLTQHETGHSTKPVVKVSYNNDIYVAYENTNHGIQEIHMVGTNNPVDILPTGYINGRNLDASLDYFYMPADFVLSTTIANEGVNQLPDMYIDLNDNVHLTWQSNRDKYWEIYYANSDTGFVNQRITKYNSRSLKPRIDGSTDGKIFITWHDDRFDNWEVMMAYCNVSRIEPLNQQDPYLASVRNFPSGWTHHLDIVPFTLINDKDTTLCISKLTVNFYKDRFLSDLAFAVNQEDVPFAFNITGAQDDSTTKTWNSFATWIIGYNEAISEEYDSTLYGSNVKSFRVLADNPSGFKIWISFKSSDISNDTGASWSDPVEITNHLGETIYNRATSSKGRYKSVKITSSNSDLQTPPQLQLVEVTSEVLQRTCITPNSDVTGYLNLTPLTRVDATGHAVTTSPLPLEYEQNRTYFVSIYGYTDEGNKYAFPNPKLSISCESCTNKKTSWNYESCSINISIPNDSLKTRYYNIRVRFYSDKETDYFIDQYDTFRDLGYFTVNDSLTASSVWTSRGLMVPAGEAASLVLWPVLSSENGLLCNIPYIMGIYYCYTDEDSETNECTGDNMILFSSTKWTCNCESPRRDSVIEPTAPVNLSTVRTWKSSANGYSDTRITETTDVSNINPCIKIRSNNEGLIVYESNRIAPWLNIYKVYASVFSIVPSYNMYATAAQSIVSPFDQVFVKSDIPICADEGCTDENGHWREDNPPPLDGQNISIDLDQFDHLFIAGEVQNDPTVCKMFESGYAQIIKVHRCGANSEEITFVTPEAIQPELPTDKMAPYIKNATFRKLINQIRVKKNDVKYTITYGSKAVVVVDKCNITLEVLGTPEVIALKLKNESGNWSDWYPFDPLKSDYTADIPWKLSTNSGLKSISIQVLTYQGRTESFSLSIVADYAIPQYEVEFYKTAQATTGDIKPEYFVKENQLRLFKEVPVASMNPPQHSGEERTSDFIFIQIIPDQNYITSLAQQGINIDSIIFDFIQQGFEDTLGLTAQKTQLDDGRIVFRGVITIHLDNEANFKDGLAEIVVHLPRGCENEATAIAVGEANYVKDQYNLMGKAQELSIGEMSEDIWQQNRDMYGMVKHKITVRPSDDPYFIFGDPNYWLTDNKDK